MPPFIKGLVLCELFYSEAVRPVLDAHFPQIAHSAARLDFGSDVLGFDTPRSMDHDWGPKVTLFVSEADYARHNAEIVQVLAERLPLEIAGYSTNYGGLGERVRYLQPIDHGPVAHLVTVTTTARFFTEYIGLDPSQPIREVDWLSIPQQRLRTVASGKVFHDGLNVLEAARSTLSGYPRDVWLYLLACQWRRIGQEEPFMGRCGDVGDELGSRLVAARQVNELMRLCFLIERQYVPYTKWFGSAFAQLTCAAEITPILHRVLTSATWGEREQHLAAAYLALARMHNALSLTRPIEPQVTPFFDRPYLVLHSGDYVEALCEAIQSPAVRALPQYVGAVGQFVDSTDVLDSIARCRALTAIYERKR